MTADKMDAPTISYEALVEEFESGLLTALRGHGVALDFLEIWVPDHDVVKSILNMAESAESLGTSAFTVTVSRETLPPSRDGDLIASLAQLGTVEISADLLDPSRAIVRVNNIGGGAVLRDLTAVLPAGLKDGVVARLPALAYAVLTPPDWLTNPSCAQAREGDTAMAVRIDPADGRLIQAACHYGATDPVERVVLDILCETIIGAPLRDAAEHGAIRALASLWTTDAPRPVAGIVNPTNAHPAFSLAQRLIRAVYADCLQRFPEARDGGYNEFDFPPSRRWMAMDADAQLQAIDIALHGFLADNQSDADAIQVLRIDDDLHRFPVRVVVSFSSQVAPAAKPDMIRALERQLKIQVESKLQVYHEQLKDQNAIRRL